MKTVFRWMAICLMAAMVMVSCDDDDDNKLKVPTVVEQEMKAKYPAATHIEWEIKSNYYVADCRLDGKDVDIWFHKEGTWVMTETELLWDNLPAAVQTTFNESEYASWRIDELVSLEYALEPIQYVIEVEQGNKDIQLFYSESGFLIQTIDVTGKDDTHWPLM